MRIFGREPAIWLAALAAIVQLLAAFWIGISVEQQALVNATAAAVAGVLTAIITKDGISAAALGVIQAAVALAIGFGLNLDAADQAVIMSAAATLASMFVRTQATAPVTHQQAP